MKNFILALVLVFLSVACSSAINKFDQVEEGIYRGASIEKEQDYADLAAAGIDVVINLKTSSDNKTLCEKYKLDCRDFGITLYPVPYSDYFFNYNTLKEAFKTVIKEHAAGKTVFFHCYAGRDRTGALASAIKLRYEACNTTYDKEKMKKELTATLQKFGFMTWVYPFLYSNILSWADNLPEWICAPVVLQ